MSELAGLLVRQGSQLSFLPASIVRTLVALPRLTRLPWDHAQIALVAGEIVAVLELAEPCGVLVVCELDGQPLALSGLSAERVGFWPESAHGVLVDGIEVPALDLRTPLARFRDGAQPQKEHQP